MHPGHRQQRTRRLRRIAIIAVLGLLGGAGGCTSIMGPTPAPSCDGGSRRPLNRSMWDWDQTQAARAAPDPGETPGDPRAERPEPSAPRAWQAPERRSEAPAPAPTAAVRQPGFVALAAARAFCTGERRHG